MLDLCSRHNIACDIELIAIQKVNEAYERVVRSDVRYRFVIDIVNSLKCKDQKRKEWAIKYNVERTSEVR
jgi:hypothetical protein